MSLGLHIVLLLAVQDIEIEGEIPVAAPIVAELRPQAPPKASSPAITPKADPPVRKAERARAEKARPPVALEAPVAATPPSDGPASSDAPVAPAADAAPASTAIAENPAPSLDKALVGRYDIAIACALKRFRKYPFQARRNEWSGTVRMQMQIGSNGVLREVRLRSSSGYSVLDEDAMETLRKAQASVPVPARLLGHEFEIDQALTYDMSGLEQGPTPTTCPIP